ncbi:hypothetical protein AAC691_19685 [Nguyenibacter vanlangensis]|uniref:Uncharacterized protein n=1 Tax=Nguyenibacter vanlangensis TaxID=1216886 RepID=A0ABZ3D4G7_9PROT
MKHDKLNGGSRKGIPNKATAALKGMVLGALDELGGQAWLVEQARRDPALFMALLHKMLPAYAVAAADTGPVLRLEEMTDEQLHALAGVPMPGEPPIIEGVLEK